MSIEEPRRLTQRSLSSPSTSLVTALHRTVFFLNLGLLAIAVIALYLRPVKGFEESFYGASGPLVWILLSLVLLSSISTVFLSILTSDESKQRFPTENLVILGATSLIIFLAPFMRGYESYGRSDSMGHVGYILDIVAERQLAIDPYPAVHMLQSVFSSVSGLHPTTLARYAPVFVYLTYWCGLYLLAGQCFPKGKGRLLSMLLGMPLIFSSFHVEVLALTFSASLMPFLVYLWISLPFEPTHPLAHLLGDILPRRLSVPSVVCTTGGCRPSGIESVEVVVFGSDK